MTNPLPESRSRGIGPRLRVAREPSAGGCEMHRLTRGRGAFTAPADLEVDRGNNRVLVRTDAHVLTAGNRAADAVAACGLAGRRVRREGLLDIMTPDRVAR